MTDKSPLASVATTLVANGYSPIPIRPDDKAPGAYGRGEWFLMRDWSRLCARQPSSIELRHWAAWPAANVGIACGFGGLIAFDVDRDELVADILAVLPPVLVAKKGQKGLTAFYKGDTSVIRSRGFKIGKLGAMDLISDGKQTVIPPSVHPDTGAPYVWTTERTLLDTKLEELPTIDESHVEAVIEVLKSYGYDPAAQSRPAMHGASVAGDVDQDAGREFFRAINDDALANLRAWVPRLGLQNIKPEGDHYRAAAEWRPSNSNKPTMRRTRHVSIHPKGIVDYGDGEKSYTAIDLVMAVFGLSQYQVDKAAVWLGGHLGYDFSPKIVLNRNRGAAAQPEPAPIEDDPEPESDGTGMSVREFEELRRLTGKSVPAAAAAPIFSPPTEVVEVEVFDLPVLARIRTWEQDPASHFSRLAQLEENRGAKIIFGSLAMIFGAYPDSQIDRQTSFIEHAAPSALYSVDMLGPVLGGAARAIASKIQVPHALAAQSVLAVASLVAQGIADVRLPTGQVRPLSLFALTVAISGDRKSSADTEAMRPVKRREEALRREYVDRARRHAARAATWRVEHEAIRKKKMSPDQRTAEFERLGPEPAQALRPVLVIPDATHEGIADNMPTLPPAIGLFSDEGGRLLGGHGFTAENKTATAANFSTLWDSGSLRRMRKTTGVTDIHGHRLAMHLMVQPNVAEKVAGDSELRGQGILARFLIAAPDTLAGTRFWREPSADDEACLDHYTARILALFDAVGDEAELSPRVLEFDPEAREAWIEFSNEIEAGQGAGHRHENFRDVAGKAAEQAARIAGVLTIIDDTDATHICGDAMLRACSLVRWYVSEAVRVFGKASAAATATDADVLMGWLNARGSKVIKVREITREGPSILRKTPRRREDAIEILVTGGYLRSLKPGQWQVIP